MKLSVNLSMMYLELPFLERFEAAKEDGFHSVEIQFPYEFSIQDIQARLKENEQECVLINVAAGDLMTGGEGLAAVPGKTAEFAAAVVECMAYARGLKVKCVNVLPGRCTDPSLKTQYLDTFKKNLLRTAKNLSPFGITTTFEAINQFDMPGFLISRGHEMLSILEEVDHPAVKAQFDIYHMSRMGVDVTGFLRRHASKIGHIQFADAPGRHEPGTGRVDFEEVFRVIEESSYAGWVGAEYRPSKPTSETLGWMSLSCIGEI